MIVLSWIQNFLQKLKKDENDEWDERYQHNDKSDDRQMFTHSKNNIKDIDAKISYDYPKKALLPQASTGKPFVEKLSEKRTNRLSKKTKEGKFTTIESEGPLTPPEKRELPTRSRGPFIPTEIPSPVYGFNRPRKTPIVEHELSHFSKEELKILPEELQQTDASSNDVELAAKGEPVHANLNELQKDQGNVLIMAEEMEIEEPTYLVKTEVIEPLETVKSVSNQTETPFLTNRENSEPEPKPPSSPRSRLPFNVLMLKQDKEKWQARNNKKSKEEALVGVEQVKEQPQEQAVTIPAKAGGYRLPSAGLLNPPHPEVKDTEWLLLQEKILNQTLTNFNVGAKVVHMTQGPAVTRFEVQPEPGVKVNKITNLSDDIKLSLAARDIRIEAPIPGKHTIGIEVPNKKSRPVPISEIVGSSVFRESPSPLTAVLGLDIAGKPIVTDLKKMPHGLIAGATGSGKSVSINSILVSLLYKASPEDLKLLLIDPKMVELAPYNRIPHLVSPVITDVKAATAALKWAVEEMERRYELFAHTGVRDINRFNELAVEHKQYADKLPFIVIIIDELADLMMMSPADVEEAICRIAQKARACGIHLIVATQRPSVDVITGLIKANIPTRIAFSVSSQIDSRTIIDIAGAEKLLGRGDMLFLENGSSKPVRLQGTFVSDQEIDKVVAHVKAEREPDYLFEQEELLKKAQVTDGEDELFLEACEFIVDQGGASTSSLQRRFKIGYNRAARLMDMLEENGYITGSNGSKPREVLITEADLESILEASNNL